MKKNNPALLSELDNFIFGLKSMKKENAFEIACGECHVTRDLFSKIFDKTDLLDQCPQSIEHAKKLKKDCDKVNEIYHSDMASFDWEGKWNCILFRFCIGYLDEDDLI